MLIKSKQSAFTLIELGIIIAIIGVMSAVAVTQMMDLTGNAEEALLEDYLQKLNSATAQYVAFKGRSPDDFSEFVAVDSASLDPETGLVIPLLYKKNDTSMPLCGTTVPTTTTLTCAGAELKRRTAVYTMDNNGVVTMVITKYASNRP